MQAMWRTYSYRSFAPSFDEDTSTAQNVRKNIYKNIHCRFYIVFESVRCYNPS